MAGRGTSPSLWYEFEAKRSRAQFIKPIIRNLYLRGPGAVQGAFAFESFMDELAATAKADPVEFRLRHMTDTRDRDVLTAAAKLAGWTPRPAGQKQSEGPTLTGRGIAVVRYGDGPPRVAIASEVEIERATGKVRVTKVSAAIDVGIVINPDGLHAQVEGSIIQGMSRALHGGNPFRSTGGDEPRLARLLRSIPRSDGALPSEVAIEMINRPDKAPTAAGEISTIPLPASIANAIFDATGKRLRQVPFTPERVKALI